ncbi:gamma-interferon-inducible lysosomal thiol reductase-like [Battus philenor]|uniref:gamma-interferon-inducible lysosomal thiol reductase-like n=1 Tax=Battus philenor TaxID=42288 RepID=UPI0035D091EE
MLIMSLYVHCLFYFTVHSTVYAFEQKLHNANLNTLNPQEESVNVLRKENFTVNTEERVTVQLYYESLCPYCIRFSIDRFTPIIKKLGQYLEIQTYPYGNAQTFKRKGKYTFQCQHGPEECYGNKLHACAIDLMQNKTQALLFNSCLMDSARLGLGSDNNAADSCGNIQNINTTMIKQCAEGAKGVQLLKYYGDKSKEAGFHYVPYILVNGKRTRQSKFAKKVCEAFANTPPSCRKMFHIA